MATIQNPIHLTLFLVGEDEEDALGNLPFDSEESATSYAFDQNWPVKIFEVTAVIDPSTITFIRAFPDPDDA